MPLASWLSSENICELEPTVEELLQHLTEKSTTHHLTLLLVIVKDGLHSGKLKAGNYRVRPRSAHATFCASVVSQSADVFFLHIYLMCFYFDLMFCHSLLQEVLSAVIITKLLFSCRLPDNCSQALWLIAPEIISAMVVSSKHA